MAVEDLWGRYPRREEGAAEPFHPPDPSLPPDEYERHPGRMEGLPRYVRLQLQVLGCPHVFSAHTALCPEHPGGAALGPADVADGAERRYLQFPVGRSGVCPGVRPRHAG